MRTPGARARCAKGTTKEPLNVRIDSALKAKVMKMAARERRSLAAQVETLLQSAMRQQGA